MADTHDRQREATSEPDVTMLIPDFPFGYDRFLAHAAGIGSVPEAAYGTRVGVVGAGLAGLVTALELMRMGLQPVLFEAAQIGGRLRTASFPTAPDVTADLGGMRFPTSSRALHHYLDRLDVPTTPFPNPLAEATSSTVIELAGERMYVGRGDELPPFLTEVQTAWQEALEHGASMAALREAIADRDVATLKRIWDDLVGRLDDESFYGFVAGSDAFRDLGFRHVEAFGQVGFGSGGWDTDFPNSMLEVLRVVATNADDDHRGVVGGAATIAERLWTHEPDDLRHWPAGTSLRSLHRGAPRGAVGSIARADDGSIVVRERWGAEHRFETVVATCQTWLLSTRIETDEGMFAPELWTAMERNHYMQSSKTFVMVDRPFWLDRDADGRDTMSMTLTDRLPRATYLLGDDPDRPGVILLSYTWNDDALKWLALPPDERVRLMLHSLQKIYPGVDIGAHIVGEPITVSWESDPNFMGAFKNNLPGQYRYQERMFGHFMQQDAPQAHRGIFLAGDDVSWTAGWAEGAVTTALNAVWGVMTHLGGATAPENPGPGDVWGRLRPVRLDPERMDTARMPAVHVDPQHPEQDAPAQDEPTPDMHEHEHDETETRP